MNSKNKSALVVAEVNENLHNDSSYLDLANTITVKLLGDQKEVTLNTRQHQVLSEAVSMLRELAHGESIDGPQNTSGDSALRIADQVIETYLPVTLSECANTFAMALGFMECFAEFARKRFGNYEDLLLDGYGKMYRQDAIFAVVPGQCDGLIEIARKGREVIVRTIHATIFRYGSLAPSMSEQVQILQFLLEAPSRMSDESKALVRTFEAQVQRCLQPESI